MANGSESAFNYTVTRVESENDSAGVFTNPSLTKLEYFAAVALQGLLSNNRVHESTPEEVAKAAVKFAHMTIESLNERP